MVFDQEHKIEFLVEYSFQAVISFLKMPPLVAITKKKIKYCNSAT